MANKKETIDEFVDEVVEEVAPKKATPKKSVEGAIAGIFGAIGFALVFILIINLIFNLTISYWQILIISIVLAIIGQIGDIAASAIKRYCGIKDLRINKLNQCIQLLIIRTITTSIRQSL